MSKPVPRLYDSFKPSNYELTLSLDPEGLSFSGTVKITGQKTGRPSKRITFHQKGLKIHSASLERVDKKGSQTLECERTNTHKRYDELRLHSGTILYPGGYTVTITFSGKITDHMQGLYPCYFEHNGKKLKLLATQFESNHAREVFPCIDEPEAKATFDLTVTAPNDPDATVLSNMPAIPSKVAEKNKDLKTVRFETTPIMSTYLLAFVYGRMHCVSAKTKDGITVKSWGTVAQPKSSLEYSAHEATKILEFFTEYFNIPYPLKKCDQVALPDFDAGAMENWGLITYREIALLTDAHNRSISSEQYVSLVVAHELSHQWFGNLVTMKWWDDLWLNESFASLMEHLALDAVHPDWQQWELYTSSDVVSTSSRDVYSDIQPVSVPVTDPDLIETLFDPGIVYAKGGRLLKMLREYIGDEAFRKGLSSYFKKFAYKNANRDDLWEALSASSGKDLKALMDPWLIQSGMPVVSVHQGTDKNLALSQQRFLLDKPADGTIWPIPLLADQTLSADLLQDTAASFTAEKDSFVILNNQGSGHYFVHYAEQEHREFIASAVASRHLSTESRINILNDMYMLSRHGDAPLTDALQVIIACGSEPRDSVWALISRILGAAAQLSEGNEDAEKALKKLRVRLGSHWFKELGWQDKDNDDVNTKQLRHTAIALMLSGEDPAAIQEALDLYQNHDLTTIPSEIRNSILSAAVRFGEAIAPQTLTKAYSVASPELQLDITSALASTKDGDLAAHILSSALGPEGFVRPQDVMRWLALFMRNRYSREAAWNYMTREWDWIESALNKSKSFDYLPTYAASVVSTEKAKKMYHDFFEPMLKNKTLERNIRVGYADIDARVAWRKRDEQSIVEWLKHTKKA